MPRPNKNNADYFPHDNDARNDKEVKAIGNKFGSKILGYAIWFMILETLCESENFRCNFSGVDLETIAGDFCIESDKLKEIVEYCLFIGLLQGNLEEIRCDNLELRLKPLLEKRNLMRERMRDRRADPEPSTPVEVIEPEEPRHSEICEEFNIPEIKIVGIDEVTDFENEEPKPKKANDKMTLKDFENFWKTYPRREGKGKAQAKFMTLKRELMDQILSKIEEYKKSSLWKDPKFIPHPTTWLNGQRWTDELIVTAEEVEEEKKNENISRIQEQRRKELQEQQEKERQAKEDDQKMKDWIRENPDTYQDILNEVQEQYKDEDGNIDSFQQKMCQYKSYNIVRQKYLNVS